MSSFWIIAGFKQWAVEANQSPLNTRDIELFTPPYYSDIFWKITIRTFFIVFFLAILTVSYSYGRAKRASEKIRYYLYGSVILTFCSLLFWRSHYSYVSGDTIQTKYYSDGRSERSQEKQQHYLYGFAILTLTPWLFWQICYSDTFADTILTRYRIYYRFFRLRRLKFKVFPLYIAYRAQISAPAASKIRGKILWFRAPRAKMLCLCALYKVKSFDFERRRRNFWWARQQKRHYYLNVFAILILILLLFWRVHYSYNFLNTILTEYYSDGRAKRASEKISIICTGWLFWHRIYYYSDGFAIRTFCFLLFWQNIILTGARSAPTKKWSLFARNLKTLLFVRWQVVKGGGWIVLYPWYSLVHDVSDTTEL